MTKYFNSDLSQRIPYTKRKRGFKADDTQALNKLEKVSELHKAVLENNINKCKSLIEARVNVKGRNEFGRTPLFEAYIRGFKEIAELLKNEYIRRKPIELIYVQFVNSPMRLSSWFRIVNPWRCRIVRSITLDINEYEDVTSYLHQPRPELWKKVGGTVSSEFRSIKDWDQTFEKILFDTAKGLLDNSAYDYFREFEKNSRYTRVTEIKTEGKEPFYVDTRGYYNYAKYVGRTEVYLYEKSTGKKWEGAHKIIHYA